MNDKASYPLDGKQKYFLLDDYPLRVLSPNTVPDVCIKGKWKPYYNVTRFMAEARPVSKDEFDKAVAAQVARVKR